MLAALFDLGRAPCELYRPPYGTNMAFRKEMFERYGGFRTDLGPGPGDAIRNEDTEFGRRLMAVGEHLRHEPSAIVYHPLLLDRVKKEYFLAWWFDYGRAQMREKGSRRPVWGIPRHYLSIPRMIGICLSERALRWMCTLNPQRRFTRKCWAWLMAGQIVETYRLARDMKSQKIRCNAGTKDKKRWPNSTQAGVIFRAAGPKADGRKRLQASWQVCGRRLQTMPTRGIRLAIMGTSRSGHSTGENTRGVSRR